MTQLVLLILPHSLTHTILGEDESTRENSMLEDDGSTQTLQPNTLQLDELLAVDEDNELFGA